MTKDEAFDYCRRMASMMGEHFEAVQILASWTDKTETHAVKFGSGNWYARQGMAHDFIQCDIAEENAVRIASKINPPDDSENWK